MMSAEPGRKAPYSADIYWRVVWPQRIQFGMELHFRDIGKNLCSSLGTVQNHFERLLMTGNVSPVCLSPSYHSPMRALSGQQELIVIGLLLDNPLIVASK